MAFFDILLSSHKVKGVGKSMRKDKLKDKYNDYWYGVIKVKKITNLLKCLG